MTTETRLELAAKLGAKEAKRALVTRCPYPRGSERRDAYVDGFMRAVATYDEPAREELAAPVEPEVEPETDTAPPVDGEGSEQAEELHAELDGSGAELPPLSDEEREAPETGAPEGVDDEPAREEPAA